MDSFEYVMVTARQQLSVPVDVHLTALLRRVSQAELPRPTRLILREKDLPDIQYAELAETISTLSAIYGVTFMWQSHVTLALRLRDTCSWIKHIQMPMSDFECHPPYRGGWESCWVSVHSLEESLRAEAMGADALIYGHIYDSSCKPDSPPRGLAELASIIQRVQIPIYAIGGIHRQEQCKELHALGCAGVCIMSGYAKGWDAHS